MRMVSFNKKALLVIANTILKNWKGLILSKNESVVSIHKNLKSIWCLAKVSTFRNACLMSARIIWILKEYKTFWQAYLDQDKDSRSKKDCYMRRMHRTLIFITFFIPEQNWPVGQIICLASITRYIIRRKSFNNTTPFIVFGNFIIFFENIFF